MELYKRTKNNKKPLIRQIIDLVPRWMLYSCTMQYNIDKGCSDFIALHFQYTTNFIYLHNLSTLVEKNDTLQYQLRF